MSNIRIGTSGWSYPGGKGTWNGIFYPRMTPAQQLAYYAEHFNTVEINTTFYGQPKAAVAATWVDRTPKDFEFSLKLCRGFTHERAATPDEAAIDLFRQGIEPL